jgi:alpha-D-ribose 1-methylphosphonate 5-triphosphate synthase subunit PhnG
MMDYSEIAAEGGSDAVAEIAEAIVNRLPVRVLKHPSPGMVMVRQVDPLENIVFLLGEAYVTECEVEVDGMPGYGCILGSSEDRALCSALLDAVIGGGHAMAAELAPLLEAEESRIRRRWDVESRAAATTRVSFEVR